MLVVDQADAEPLKRMGAKGGTIPPALPGAAVRAAGGAALKRLAAAGNATHPEFASLTVAAAPGFAHRWLELAEAEPWPADDRNAEKVRLRLVEKNADSPERLAWLEASHASRPRNDTCANPDGCAEAA